MQYNGRAQNRLVGVSEQNPLDLELKHRPTTDINLVSVLCCIVELVLQFFNFELPYSIKKCSNIYF